MGNNYSALPAGQVYTPTEKIMKDYNKLVLSFFAQVAACNSGAYGCAPGKRGWPSMVDKFLPLSATASHHKRGCSAMRTFNELLALISYCFRVIDENPTKTYYMFYKRCDAPSDTFLQIGPRQLYAFPLLFATDETLKPDQRRLFEEPETSSLRSVPRYRFDSNEFVFVDPSINPAKYDNLKVVCNKSACRIVHLSRSECVESARQPALEEYNARHSALLAAVGACNAGAYGCPPYENRLVWIEKFVVPSKLKAHRARKCPAMGVFDEMLVHLRKCMELISSNNTRFYMIYEVHGVHAKYAIPSALHTDETLPNDIRDSIKWNWRHQPSFGYVPRFRYDNNAHMTKFILTDINPAAFNNLISLEKP